MSKCAVLLLISAARSFGLDCIPYGTSTTLAGRLFLKDESGYNQFTAMKLQEPICTSPDRRKGLEAERGETGVQEIQAGVYGSDKGSSTLRDRLERLVGHQVEVKGILFPAQTGYHRTSVQVSVESVDPVDSAGQHALRTPMANVQPRKVAAYEVTINAGSRLMIEAQDAASMAPLIPSEKYAPHWMTGGEVVYVNCLDGYQRKLVSTTEKNGGICFDGDLCGFPAFPQTPIIIKFRCIKKP